MFNFLLAQCHFVYLRVFLTKNLFSAVYCRVFFSLSCIVVYVVSCIKIHDTRYTLHDTRRFRVLKMKL